MKLLVFNSDLSGLNKFLIEHLKQKGWKVIIENLPDIKILKPLALMSSIQLNPREWRKRASEKLDRLNKTELIFNLKTNYCDNVLKKYRNSVDIILQFSGMFMPCRNVENLCVPYVIYTDYTVKLTEKYLPWTPFPSQRLKWYKLEKELYENSRYVFTSNENARKSVITDYSIESAKVINAGCGLTFNEIEDFKKSYKEKF